MRIEIDPADFRPLIQLVVAETLAQRSPLAQAFEGRLALPEAKAAEACSAPSHVLRDERLEGNLVGTKIGRKVYYTLEDLQDFLRRRRFTGRMESDVAGDTEAVVARISKYRKPPAQAG